jgi:hypothetical protein
MKVAGKFLTYAGAIKFLKLSQATIERLIVKGKSQITRWASDAFLIMTSLLIGLKAIRMVNGKRVLRRKRESNGQQLFPLNYHSNGRSL